MADKNKEKAARLQRRKWRVRKRVVGTADRPRLSVYRSQKHICAQIIDDTIVDERTTGRTLAYVTTTSKALRGEMKNGATKAAAELVGRAIAQKALALGITKVCFDRGGRAYHGRIKALAEAARKAGLKF